MTKYVPDCLPLYCESSGVRADIVVRITTVQMQRYWKHSFHSQEVWQCPGFNLRDTFPLPNNATNLRCYSQEIAPIL